jgi:hypothetical protein
VPSALADLLETSLPEGLRAILARILGASMPQAGADARYGVLASGRFRGAITADLLAFAANNKLDAALVLVDEDTERVLYFEGGLLIGAASNVLFERIGRLLYRIREVDHVTSEALIEAEEKHGPAALETWMPRAILGWAAERRIWEIVAALYLVPRGHFVLVEGKPELGRLLTTALDPMHVALEGLRQHDQWRHGSRKRTPEATEATEEQDAARQDVRVTVARRPSLATRTETA